MWFMKYIANPLVCLILRSPLHWMMSKTVLLITVFGRKSKTPYHLPVNYVQSGNTLFILPGMPEQKTWWRNLQGGAEVKIVLRGKEQKAIAEVLSGEKDCPDTAEALRAYFKQFPASAKMRQIRGSADGGYVPEDLYREAASSIMVRVRL